MVNSYTMKSLLFIAFICFTAFAYGISSPSVNSKRLSPDYFQIALDGVKSFEGFREKPYKCPAGVRTIGYGFTGPLAKVKSISKEDADLLLTKELHQYVLSVEDNVKVPLTRNQLYALASFTYNCGEGNLRQLVNGKNRLNSGNYKSVERLLPKYRKGGGKVLKGLQKRREWEVKLWKGEL